MSCFRNSHEHPVGYFEKLERTDLRKHHRWFEDWSHLLVFLPKKLSLIHVIALNCIKKNEVRVPRSLFLIPPLRKPSIPTLSPSVKFRALRMRVLSSPHSPPPPCVHYTVRRLIITGKHSICVAMCTSLENFICVQRHSIFLYFLFSDNFGKCFRQSSRSLLKPNHQRLWEKCGQFCQPAPVFSVLLQFPSRHFDSVCVVCDNQSHWKPRNFILPQNEEQKRRASQLNLWFLIFGPTSLTSSPGLVVWLKIRTPSLAIAAVRFLISVQFGFTPVKTIRFL